MKPDFFIYLQEKYTLSEFLEAYGIDWGFSEIDSAVQEYIIANEDELREAEEFDGECNGCEDCDCGYD